MEFSVFFFFFSFFCFVFWVRVRRFPQSGRKGDHKTIAASRTLTGGVLGWRFIIETSGSQPLYLIWILIMDISLNPFATGVAF